MPTLLTQKYKNRLEKLMEMEENGENGLSEVSFFYQKPTTGVNNIINHPKLVGHPYHSVSKDNEG